MKNKLFDVKNLYNFIQFHILYIQLAGPYIKIHGQDKKKTLVLVEGGVAAPRVHRIAPSVLDGSLGLNKNLKRNSLAVPF